MAMQEEQKEKFINNCLVAVKQQEKYSQSWHALWRQINNAVDSWYDLYGRDVVIDKINNKIVYVED